MSNLAWWCQVSRRTECHLGGGKFEKADGPLQRPDSTHKLGMPCVSRSVCGHVYDCSAAFSQPDLGGDPFCFLEMSQCSSQCIYERSFQCIYHIESRTASYSKLDLFIYLCLYKTTWASFSFFSCFWNYGEKYVINGFVWSLNRIMGEDAQTVIIQRLSTAFWCQVATAYIQRSGKVWSINKWLLWAGSL